VDFDPLAFFMLLNFEIELLQPIQFFDFANESLEGTLSTVVKNTADDGTANLSGFIKPYTHYNKHDQVEQGKLQNNEANVG
jgi:hypothetical protein